MNAWKMLAAGMAAMAALSATPAVAAGAAAPAQLRPLPASPRWNADGLSWEALRGKVVIVDLWNWH